MSGRKIVLVEGRDDEHVIKHLWGSRELPACLEVEPSGSVESLLEALPTRLKATNDGDIVAIVLDADDNLQDRWQQVRHRLVRASYLNVPENPAPSGTIIDAPEASILPRIGVWLMPDNQIRGILEDFLALLVPADSALFAHAKQAVAQIPVEQRLFPPVAEPKVLIHTWLAWQEKPGLPLGIAITARCLDPFQPEADRFVAWLRQLFQM